MESNNSISTTKKTNKRVKFSFLFYVYVFFLIVSFFESMGAYVFWNIKYHYIYWPFLLISIAFLFKKRTELKKLEKETKPKKKTKSKSLDYLIIVFAFIVAFWGAQVNGFWGIIRQVCEVFPILICMQFLSENELSYVLRIINKWFSFILVVSLFFWLLGIIVDFPSFGIINGGDDNYVYYNHIFYLQNKYDIGGFRFCSIFREPGHVSMICAFMLFANKYDFHKKYNWVYLLTIIVSFGLSGYVLLVVGLFIYLCINLSWKYVKWLIFSGIVLLGVYYFGVHYNGGDNVINELIISRLEFDEDKGVSGNNRVSLATEFNFLRAVLTGDIINGYGVEGLANLYNPDEFIGAGYMVYLLTYGIIGTVLVLLVYFFICLKSPMKKYAFGMLLLYSISFIQRAYPLWESWIIPFICATLVHKPAKLISLKRRKKKRLNVVKANASISL